MTTIPSSVQQISSSCAKRRRIQYQNGSTKTKSSTTSWLLCILCFVLLIKESYQQQDEDGFSIRATDAATCYTNLFTSDSDGDGRVDNEEYVTFVKLQDTSGLLQSFSSFVELPIMLQSNFFTLSCFCRSQAGSASDCCVGDNAHISTNGTNPLDTPTEEQEQYLNLVCGLTDRAIDMTVAELSTPSPTIFPTIQPSVRPPVITSRPTDVPTTAVTTSPPTVAPTIITTGAPTSTPTANPNPTVSPSPTVTYEPVEVIVKTSYSILVANGTEEISYTNSLIAAMDIVAQNVATTLNVGNTRRKTKRRRQLLEDQEQQNQLQLRHRRLEILVTIPTEIDDIIDVGYTTNPQLVDGTFVRGPCPYDIGDPTTDICEEVTASIILELSSPQDNPVSAYGLFLAALDNALIMGDLNEAFLEVAPADTPVIIATGQPSQGGPPPTTDGPTVAPTGGGDERTSGLSVGAIAGIAAGAAALVLVFACAVAQQYEVNQKQQRAEIRKEKAEALRNKELQDPEAPLPDDYYDDEHDEGTKSDKEMAEIATAASTEPSSSQEARSGGPSQSNLGQQLHPEEEKQPEEDDTANLMMAPVPYISPTKSDNGLQGSQRIEILGSEDLMHHGSAANLPAENRSIGNISHESEGGWSENYTSSMGTMSDDEMLPELPSEDVKEDEKIENLGPNSPLSETPLGQMSTTEARFEDLEHAIVAGDWAAVGATAAALAAMQDTQSKSTDFSSSSAGISALSSLRSHSQKNSGDADKAAKIDQLIEQGDWEGIVSAAAQFEAEASGAPNVYNISSNASSASGGSGIMVHEDGSDDETETTQGGYSESVQSNDTGFTGSQKRSKEELREEVKRLVEMVVPEEVDHVDEMLDQFAGRETELIDTLATMQERAAAQAKSGKEGGKSLAKGKFPMS
jgi:hypothetical protein